MELFKQRGTAVAVFVVVVILFTLIGCHRSLGKACRRVENAFFDREALISYVEDLYIDANAYTAPAEQLENGVKLANRLLSVIHGSDELAAHYNSLLAAREALADALRDRDISDICDAESALIDTVTALDDQVQAGAPLPASYDDYASIVFDLYSVQRVAAESPYNEVVDEFVRTTASPFPTDILRLLSHTALPEKYE